MARRPTITDLARQAGVSVATVDRVLNGRHPVREETARHVYEAAQALGYHASGLIRHRIDASLPSFRLGFLLQQPQQRFYRLFGVELERAVSEARDFRASAQVDFLETQTPAEIIRRLHAMAARCDAVAMVAIDHPSVTAAVREVQASGIPVVALLSDFAQGHRTAYVGLDNRKVGRTAGWLAAHIGKQPGKLGVFVGSPRFLGHELREIGFRSYIREFAPGFEVLDAQVNLEAGSIAHEATLAILSRHPDLAGLYVAGGGMEGAVAALREEGMAGKLAVICNENNDFTRAALAEGVVSALIATPLRPLSNEIVALLGRVLAGAPGRSDETFLPMEILLPESV